MKPRLALYALCALAAINLIGAAALADPIATGSISGVIKDTKGNPVPGLTVRLQQDLPHTADKGGKRGAGDDQGGIKIIARGITNAKAEFEFKDIPAGTYQLICGNKQIGWIYQEVTVIADQETKLDDLQLVQVK